MFFKTILKFITNIINYIKFIEKKIFIKNDKLQNKNINFNMKFCYCLNLLI